MCHKSFTTICEMIEKGDFAILISIFYSFGFHSSHGAPKSNIAIIDSNYSIRGSIVLKINNLFIADTFLRLFGGRLELETGSCKLVSRWAFQYHVDIPASHHAILIARCDHTRHLIVILWICENPSDRFIMVPSYSSNWKWAFSLRILGV